MMDKMILLDYDKVEYIAKNGNAFDHSVLDTFLYNWHCSSINCKRLLLDNFARLYEGVRIQ